MRLWTYYKKRNKWALVSFIWQKWQRFTIKHLILIDPNTKIIWFFAVVARRHNRICFLVFTKEKKKVINHDMLTNKNHFIAKHLLRKIAKFNTKWEKEIIVTWSWTSTSIPKMIDPTIAIHNGKEHYIQNDRPYYCN